MPHLCSLKNAQNVKHGQRTDGHGKMHTGELTGVWMRCPPAPKLANLRMLANWTGKKRNHDGLGLRCVEWHYSNAAKWAEIGLTVALLSKDCGTGQGLWLERKYVLKINRWNSFWFGHMWTGKSAPADGRCSLADDTFRTSWVSKTLFDWNIFLEQSCWGIHQCS